MTLDRRAAVFLLAVAVWNVLTYAAFIRNLFFAGPLDEPTGYYVAHSVLIIVNLAIAAVLAPMGWRAWRTAGHESRV